MRSSAEIAELPAHCRFERGESPDLLRVHWTMSMQVFPELGSSPSTRARFLELIEERPTPFFLLDAAILTDRAVVMRELLAEHWGPSAVAYSFKTNYQVAELPLLDQPRAALLAA